PPAEDPTVINRSTSCWAISSFSESAAAVIVSPWPSMPLWYHARRRSRTNRRFEGISRVTAKNSNGGIPMSRCMPPKATSSVRESLSMSMLKGTSGSSSPLRKPPSSRFLRVRLTVCFTRRARRRRRLTAARGGFAPAVGPTPAAIIETVQASSARTSPTSGRQPRSCGLLVDGHDGGAAEADVVLQGDLGALDLAGVGRAAQLPDELRALRQAGGAERVALGDQAPRGIDDGTVAAVGGGLGVDELVALALAGKTERLVGDQLVGAEAVVELHHVHFLDPGLGLIQRTLGCRPCHVGADDHDRGLRLEGARQVGHHCLAGDLAGLGTQAMSFDEALACDDRGGAAVGWGRALQLCQWRVYLLGVLDVLQRVLVLELRKGVVDGVLVVLPPDPGVVLGSRAVSLHVLASSHPEHLRGKRRGLPLPQLPERSHVTVHRIGAICELGARRPHLHLLEAEGERAVDEPALDGLASEIQGARASRAVVVDVDHRDAGEPKPIQGSLTGSGVAVAIRREGLLDRLVGNPGI